MATKKPVVFYGNEQEELRAGDNIEGATGGTSSVSRTNANASPIVRGHAVYASSGTAVDLARANASGTIGVLGLVQDATVASSNPATVQLDGTLTATATEWDAVTGQSGGLTVNTEYILSPATAGRIVPKSTTISGGEWVVPIGRAISATELQIYPQHPAIKRN